MRILVTGARGFVGRHVVEAANQAGFDVRILTRSPADDAACDVVVGDLTDRRIAAAAMRDVDAVVHLAARVHVMREEAADPLAEFRRANVAPTITLAEAARECGVGTFVLASSVKAVGEATTRPWTRSTPAAPVDPYGVSKREAEVALRALANGMRGIAVRFPLVYGPGVKGNMRALMQLVDRGLPIPVSTQVNARSLLYVRNAAAAIIHVAATGGAGATGAPYFLSDGAPSTRQLVGEIAAALGRRPRVLPVPTAAARTLAAAADGILGARLASRVDRLFGSLEVDASDFFRDFAFDLPFSRSEGLADTARCFRSAVEPQP